MPVEATSYNRSMPRGTGSVNVEGRRRRPSACMRKAAAGSALALAASIGLTVGTASAVQADEAVTTTFTTPGGPYTYAVPAGVTILHVHAVGGRGSTTPPTSGGFGADVVADVPVSAGQTIYVHVAGNGTLRTGGTDGAGGGNGGGQPPAGQSMGGGGGGASDIRLDSDDLTSRIVVAGGGGGSAYFDGGNAGDGGHHGPGPSEGPVATPGTDTAGGTGGNREGKAHGADGTFGQGGAGAYWYLQYNGGATTGSGGGGGGGWYGGGGGAPYDSGAGGSSHVDASASNVAIGTDSTQVPLVSVSYSQSTSTVTTQAATAVTAYSATLNGTVSPNSSATTYHFEYGATTNYGSSTSELSAGTGSTSQPESAVLTGLPPKTAYHYRMVATNPYGTSIGADQTFATTSAGPTATSSAATQVGSFSATVHGTVNPNNQPTTYHFEYGPTATGTYGSSTNELSAGSDYTDHPVTADLKGLAPATTYHFRVCVANDTDVFGGSDEDPTVSSFTTSAAPPTATTGVAAGAGAGSATLHGTVNPNNAATTYHFEYGTTTSYGTSTTDLSAGGDYADHPASADLSRLTSATTYHFRVVASNASGTNYGADRTFTSAAAPVVATKPRVSTGGVTGRQQRQVTAHGVVNPRGRPTTYYIEFGRTAHYGRRTVPVGIGAVRNDVAVARVLRSLLPGRSYHYRVVASNKTGTTRGADRTFTTRPRG